MVRSNSLALEVSIVRSIQSIVARMWAIFCRSNSSCRWPRIWLVHWRFCTHKSRQLCTATLRPDTVCWPTTRAASHSSSLTLAQREDYLRQHADEDDLLDVRAISIYLSIYLSVYLSIYLSISLYFKVHFWWFFFVGTNYFFGSRSRNNAVGESTASDVCGAGVVIHELWTGHVPTSVELAVLQRRAATFEDREQSASTEVEQVGFFIWIFYFVFKMI